MLAFFQLALIPFLQFSRKQTYHSFPVKLYTHIKLLPNCLARFHRWLSAQAFASDQSPCCSQFQGEDEFWRHQKWLGWDPIGNIYPTSPGIFWNRWILKGWNKFLDGWMYWQTNFSEWFQWMDYVPVKHFEVLECHHLGSSCSWHPSKRDGKQVDTFHRDNSWSLKVKFQKAISCQLYF